ncbi:Site-specific DNA recombinase [Rhodococcoides kroppenstedtii]|uniref:Site-specific DNA recombinase n=1 Tax=Rhodococcoides kroppenstedtii TaxID=293050 RepID=A0A1I0UBR0_9NOCA|nr:recombinase family protein [Rhodococcus kroppenstedtii]SFA61481.1 Site-specific DNA recombinase [Rhodococcus kroppenstedtii]
MSTRTAVYVRISSDRDERKVGVDRQEQDCRSLASNLGWTVEHVYVDNDTSAWKKTSVELPDGSKVRRNVRPLFEQMLTALRRGEYDSLIAYDLDRVAREPRDLENLIEVVEQFGRTVKSYTGNMALDSDHGIYSARGEVNHANKSSRDTSRRVRDAARHRAMQGQYHGASAAFGYELVKDEDGKVITLREHREHAPMVREAYAHLLSGGSLHSIVKRWNEEKRTTSRGNPWRSSPLKRALTTATIIGMREHAGELFPAEWPALVNKDDWDKLRTLLSDPSRRRQGFGSGPGTGRYVLSGLVRCGGCGRSMVASVYSGGRGTRGWVCAMSNTSGCTNSSRIARDPLETYVVEGALARLDSDALAPDDEEGDQHVELRQAIDADHTRLRQLEDDYYDGLFKGDRAGYVRQRDRLTSRIADSERQLLSAAQKSVLAGIDSVETLRGRWEDETVARRNAILGAIIDKIVIGKYPAGLPYTLHHRKSETLEEFEGRKRAHQLAVLEARVTIEWRA